MGLTIHYQLRLPAAVAPATAEALVRTAHRRAASLVRRRGLEGLGRVEAVDPENPWHSGLVLETRGRDTFGHDVPPECGWLFMVHLGAGCESALFGLCRHPATIRVGRRVLPTGCAGWGYAGFCKTQYASRNGEDAFLRRHRAVIDLALIWKRLGATVTIKDEGGYWPGRDEVRLLDEVRDMNRLVAALGGALKDAAEPSGATVASPIFEHGSFELLEAEGLAQYAEKIDRTVGVVRALTS